MRNRLVILLALAGSAVLPVSAGAAGAVPEGAAWSEATIPSTGGVKLHADILRPKDLPADARTPVILSIGPYFNHSGQVGPAGPIEDADYDPVGPPGPSDRFKDFVEGAKLMERGYTFVMVDLRGFGGSTGCLDWGGPGIRRLNSVATPALYDLIDLTPGTAQDSPDYNLAGLDSTQRPGCPVLNLTDQAANDDHYSDYWRKRNLIPGATGSGVPLFLTQGLTENNTVADGSAQYLQNHTGPERAWLGPWEHVRGNETDGSGRLKMGRAGFFDEVMRFYDRYLKGEAPAVQDPPVAVQTNDGKWRAEQSWPPADS